MSDTMLLGVLRMPFESAMATTTAQIQYHQRGVQAADEIEKRTRERDEARAEVEKLRVVLKIAASYVNSCYHEWYLPRDLAEALRDLTKIREVLNDERAGELEGKP